MRMLFTFIVEHPFMFLVIALGIYAFATYKVQQNKIEKINKAFKPIKNYLDEKFSLIERLLNALDQKYVEEDEITNELKILRDSIELYKSENNDDKVKAANKVNYFVLNSGLIRSKKHEELSILLKIELFVKDKTEDSIELENYRLAYNELVTDFNHDSLNPPNSIIVQLFGINSHFNIIEINEGKTPDQAAAYKVEKKNIELKDSDEIKVCPNCHTEFTKSKFCPTCGQVVIK